MSKLNRPFYIANVLSVANADSRIRGRESEVLRSIFNRIGAEEQDLADAAKLLASGRYQIHLSDQPAENKANLDDMVMVALADGDVSPREAAPIEEAAQLMGYAQTDMDMVVRRAEQALGQLAQISRMMRKHPPIHVPRSLGKKPAEKDPAPPPLPSKTPELTPPLPAVPANSEPVIERSPEPSPAPFVEEPGGTAEQESAAYAGGAEACMARRAASTDPDLHCFGLPDRALNVWGCRLAGMDWEAGAAWLSMGAFRDDESFVFDKQAIAEHLTARLADAMECPHLNSTYTEKAFEALPARANARSHWDYREAEADDPDAGNVTVTRYIHGCPITDKLRVCGVDPQDPVIAQRIIGRAMRDSNRSSPSLRALQIGQTET